MKKNMLKATLVVAFALVAGWNVYNAQKKDAMSDLALANVEALASNDEVIIGPYYCAGSGYCAIDGVPYDGSKYYF